MLTYEARGKILGLRYFWIRSVRELIDIEPTYFKVSADQLQSLSDELYASLENDPSLLLPALRSFDEFELLDILREEFRSAPDSLMSVELRRRVREHCNQAARKIAVEIFKA